MAAGEEANEGEAVEKKKKKKHGRKEGKKAKRKKVDPPSSAEGTVGEVAEEESEVEWTKELVANRPQVLGSPRRQKALLLGVSATSQFHHLLPQAASGTRSPTTC